MAAHQQNVPGFQMIGFSFYVIRHFAGKKHNDLVKIVIVIGKCPVLPVTEMKKPELLVEIAGFFHLFHGAGRAGRGGSFGFHVGSS